MKFRPVIVHSNRNIYVIYGETKEEREIAFEAEQVLKRFVTQKTYTNQLSIYCLDDYSIWCMVVSGEESIKQFKQFLYNNSKNVIPQCIYEIIDNFNKQFKEVCLYEDKMNIIIKILRGEVLSIFKKNKKLEYIYQSEKQELIFDKVDKRKVLNKLASKQVHITKERKKQDYSNAIPLQILSKEGMQELRYYQSEAFNSVIDKGFKDGIIFMPPGAGKTLVGVKLIEYLKQRTLILNDNTEEYWKDYISENLYLKDASEIGIIKEENDEIKPITICSYSNITKFIDKLTDYNWELIIYDDAHRALADTYSESLDIFSHHKIAFAATLARADGKGGMLYDIIGPRLYNISWYELEVKGYQKHVKLIKIIIPKNKSRDSMSIKMKICQKLMKLYKDKRIAFVTYNTKKDNTNEIINSSLSIDVLDGNTDENFRREKVKSFNSDFINKICISLIFEKLQIKDIDVLVAISYQKGSEREETFRLGRVKSCSKKLDKPCTGLLYSLVDFKEDKYFTGREVAIAQYGCKYESITLENFLRGIDDEY